MISKTWSRKPIAALVAVAILSVYSMVVLASPAAKAPSGELSIAGQATVNGEAAVSGGTVFSESVIATAEKSVATVNLSKLGRVELLPSSSMKRNASMLFDRCAGYGRSEYAMTLALTVPRRQAF